MPPGSEFELLKFIPEQLLPITDEPIPPWKPLPLREREDGSCEGALDAGAGFPAREPREDIELGVPRPSAAIAETRLVLLFALGRGADGAEFPGRSSGGQSHVLVPVALL